MDYKLRGFLFRLETSEISLPYYRSFQSRSISYLEYALANGCSIVKYNYYIF